MAVKISIQKWNEVENSNGDDSIAKWNKIEKIKINPNGETEWYEKRSEFFSKP